MEYRDDIFEECEDGDEEVFEEDDMISCFENNESKEKLEITFKVKKDFEKLFKAICKADNILPCSSTPITLTDMVKCINLHKRVINKAELYTKMHVNYREDEKKEVKRAFKKSFGELLQGKDYMSWDYMGTFWSDQFKFSQIFEKNNEMYCRMEIQYNLFSNNFMMEAVGEKIGSFAREITEAVKVCTPFENSYTPLEFEVVDGCIKVHGITENDVSIKLIDKTKVYMVKANIMIPETMVNVIKQIDKIDQVIESVQTDEKDDRYKLQLMYEKLIYDYDMTCAFLRDHSYAGKVFGYRLYEKDRMFKEFSDKIKKILVNKDDECFSFEYSDDHSIVTELASKLSQAEENKFSDDYRHWIFSGTFINIERDFLEMAFEKVKSNMQMFGVPEQYIDIRVAEVQ